MAEPREKLLSFDEFKEKVYRNIWLLESFQSKAFDDVQNSPRDGCLESIFMSLVGKIISTSTYYQEKHMRVAELTANAENILAQKETKELLCAKLDASVKLPIDAAYKLTPVLYKLALENEENVPMNSTLFAIICRKLTTAGVDKYCQ